MEYVYLLKNKKTNRIYVGRTQWPEIRFRQHMNALKSGKHNNELMQSDFDVFGEDSFYLEVVEQKEHLTRSGIEGMWMLRLRTYDKRFGYNYKDPFVWSRQGFATKHVELVNV